MMVERLEPLWTFQEFIPSDDGEYVRYSDYASLAQLVRDIEDSILSCEKGQTIYDVLANYRSVRRTILTVREAEKEVGNG